MNGPIPDHLQSTADLLQKAYGNVIPPEDYLAVVAILYDHMSHRNIADVVSHFTNNRRDRIDVLNDVNSILSTKPTAESLLSVRARLEQVGLAEWIASSD